VREFRTRSAATTVDNGLEGAALLDMAAPTSRCTPMPSSAKANDYRVRAIRICSTPAGPSTASSRTAARYERRVDGRLLHLRRRFVGAAVVQDNAFYGIPGIDGSDHNTHIDARQTRC